MVPKTFGKALKHAPKMQDVPMPDSLPYQSRKHNHDGSRTTKMAARLWLQAHKSTPRGFPPPQNLNAFTCVVTNGFLKKPTAPMPRQILSIWPSSSSEVSMTIGTAAISGLALLFTWPRNVIPSMVSFGEMMSSSKKSNAAASACSRHSPSSPVAAVLTVYPASSSCRAYLGGGGRRKEDEEEGVA